MKRILYFILSFLLLLGNVSCEKLTLPEGPPTSSQAIMLDHDNLELTVGEEKTIKLSVENGKSFVKRFSFSSSTPEIVSVEKDGGFGVKLMARRAGTAVVKFIADDKDVELTCNVTVKEVPSDGITRILAIGNSFSEDALEAYLHSIATQAGDSIVIGNLYIGGSSLEQHLTNANQNNKAYSYRKIDKSGRKTTTNNVAIADVLNEERWDYISFQQVSQSSGQYATFETTLPALYNYVKNKVIYSKTKYIFHQTWAYAQNSTHDGFANYNRDQLTMYNSIKDAVQRAATLIQADRIVPAGTAIQNGRTTFWGDNFCRDGYHLDLNVGRYLAACTWYEAIFGKSVIGNPYNPGSFMLSRKEMEMAQHAAHAAILKPFEITEMTNFKQVDVSEFTTPVYLDFGQKTQTAGWNGVTSPLAGTTVPFLREKSGSLTSLSLTIIERFNNLNEAGELNTVTDFNMPNSVSQTNYYGNPKQPFLNLTVPKSVVRISGLDPAKNYNFCFFGSRGGTAETRQTKFISKGQNEAIAYLNVGSNKTNVACTNGIKPDTDGNVFITVTAGEQNDNPTGFYHLSAMRISVQ